MLSGRKGIGYEFEGGSLTGRKIHIRAADFKILLIMFRALSIIQRLSSFIITTSVRQVKLRDNDFAEPRFEPGTPC